MRFAEENHLLRKFAGQWRKSFESIEWSHNVLSPALVKIFEDAGLPTDGVFVSKLAFSANPKQHVSVNFNFLRSASALLDELHVEKMLKGQKILLGRAKRC